MHVSSSKGGMYGILDGIPQGCCNINLFEEIVTQWKWEAQKSKNTNNDISSITDQ